MNKSAEIGLQDLLFNGAISCLLLFIIFAIKANGYAVISSLAGVGDQGKYQSNTSLPINNEVLQGEMISYRKVHVQGLGLGYRENLLNKNGWTWVTDGKIRQSIEFVGNDVVFIASYITHPSNLKLKLSIPSPVPYNVSAFVTEGESAIQGRLDSAAGTCSISMGGII